MAGWPVCDIGSVDVGANIVSLNGRVGVLESGGGGLPGPEGPQGPVGETGSQGPQGALSQQELDRLTVLESKAQNINNNTVLNTTQLHGQLCLRNPVGAAFSSNMFVTCENKNACGVYCTNGGLGGTLTPYALHCSNLDLTGTATTNIRCGDSNSIELQGTTNVKVGKNLTSDKFVTRGGTNVQFVKGDGSLDSVGPQGPQGPQGATGATGVTGAQGIDGPSVFGGLYPFSSATRTGVLTAASRTYCTTYTMTATHTLTTVSVFYGSAGSDTARIGIYRGDLTTATLVGQTVSSTATSNYMTRTIVAEANQNLNFAFGEQITVAYTTSGSTSTPAFRTTTSNIALGVISSTTYQSNFPTSISSIAAPTATTTRICMEFA